MKKKSKGFTLIELLAVIVILGIILTIVVTNVVKYIGEAKKGAFKDTYVKLINEVKNRIALRQLGDSSVTIECSDANCSSEYNLDNNIKVNVAKINDEDYLVYVNGQNSFENITFDSNTCPKDAECVGKYVTSKVSQNGSINKAERENIMFIKNKKNIEKESKIMEGCSTLNFCKEQGYGDNIKSITYSLSGIYYLDVYNKYVIIDKNGNKLEDTENFGKYVNFIGFNGTATSLIKNYELKNASDVICTSGTPYYFSKRNITTNNTKYNENLAYDKYLYAKENSSNKIFIFTCIENDLNYIKPTLNNNTKYTELK